MAVAPLELRELAKEYLKACVGRDVDYLEANTVEDEVSGFIGIHSGVDAVDRSIADSRASIGPLDPANVAHSDPQGWVVGDVAWFTDFPHAVLPNGEVLPDPVRFTLIMRRVDGDWKAAYWHLSEGVDRDLDKDAPEQV